MDQLSTEIIAQICGALCRHCTLSPTLTRSEIYENFAIQEKPLANLCLTSSRLREIAQPFLYHHIFIQDRQRLPSVSLLATLTFRPDLAWAVKHLILADIFGTVRRLRYGSSSASALYEAFRRAVTQAGLRLPDAGSSEYLSPHPDRLIQQLLIRVPRLEFLALLPLSTEGWDILPSVDDQATPSHPTLRQVVLEYNDVELGYDLSVVANLFSLGPNIDNLSLETCNGVSCIPSLQNVTCLALRHGSLSAKEMARLLSSCGKLDTFLYGSAARHRADGLEREVSADEVVRILQEQGHGRTLRRLCLDYGMSFQQPPESIGSLMSFSQLQELWLGCISIRWPGGGSENAQTGVLPTSLREIGLFGRFNAEASTYERIVAQASNGVFPGLKNLSFDRGKQWFGHDDARNKFRARFQHL